MISHTEMSVAEGTGTCRVLESLEEDFAMTLVQAEAIIGFRFRKDGNSLFAFCDERKEVSVYSVPRSLGDICDILNVKAPEQPGLSNWLQNSHLERWPGFL